MGASVGVGDVLAGKYVIEHELGSGGMGVVLAARHVDLDTRVAVKLMRGEALEDPQAAVRFLREARAAARLKGEHIARVTDYGKLESGEPYSVIEYLDGKDLSQVVRDGEIPIGHAVEYVCQACEAIAEAHAQGIVHRDIKPSNLFLTRYPNGKPCIKVLDFGISKFTVAGEHSLELAKTSTKAVLGSPLYMSPEQMRASRDVDARSDIWSLGATLYQLLTRTVPFTAETMMELCMKVANEEPPSLRGLRQEIPAPLEAAVLRCLRRELSDRFQTVAELVTAIAPFAAAGRASAADIVVVAHARTSSADSPPSSLDPSGPTRPDVAAATEAIGPKLAATDPTWGKTQGQKLEASRWRSGVVLGATALVLVAAALGWKMFTAAGAEPSSAPANAALGEATTTPAAPTRQPSVDIPIVVPEPETQTAAPLPAGSASAEPKKKPPVKTSVPVPRKPKPNDPMANPL